MKTITRNVNRFDEWSNSWFTDPVEEYVIVNNVFQWIADKLPKKLVYFCYIRFMTYVTTHGEGEFMTPDEIGFSKAVEIWEAHNYQNPHTMQEKTLEEEFEDFIEKGADLEHERWSKWQSYFFSKCSVKPQSQVNGMDDRYVYLALPKDLYERWVRQMNTSYNELSEQEKESDRIEVRKYIPLVTELISSREEKAREEGKKEGYESHPKVLYAQEVITQYKEELKEKLPKENELGVFYKNSNHVDEVSQAIGFNDCLSKVKKLIK